MKTSITSQSGFAHVGLIVLVTAVVTVGGFAYWRVSNSNKTQYSGSDTSEVQKLEVLPESIDQIKSLDEIQQIATSSKDVAIISFVLETKDGTVVYKVKTSDGREVIIDAETGRILSESTFEVADDEDLPSGVSITVSPSEAYRLATAEYGKRVKQIELEVEDNKVVYKIEFIDGSKIELNASNGVVVRSQIKDQGDDSNDDDSGSDDRKSSSDEDEHSSGGRDEDEVEVEDEDENESEDDEIEDDDQDEDDL